MNTTTSKNSFGDLIRKMGISEEKEEPVKLEKPQPVSHNEPPKPAIHRQLSAAMLKSSVILRRAAVLSCTVMYKVILKPAAAFY